MNLSCCLTYFARPCKAHNFLILLHKFFLHRFLQPIVTNLNNRHFRLMDSSDRQRQELQKLREERANLSLRLENTKREIDDTDRKIEILEAELASGEYSTAKNARRHKIWSQVEKILLEMDNSGEKTVNLWKRVNRVYPEVQYGTFRAYMNKFKAERRIYQPTGQRHWRMTQPQLEKAKQRYIK